MKIYLVGGAVRDSLLGRSVKERDWVVVGASPEEMLELGYKPVGKDFPVFLHPETHEEYALARTERKVAKGYKGFVFHADPSVTLDEDLKRRDLTINAIAQDDQGLLIDPYHGQQDLKDQWFRHVSPAFAEDPVRILRIARFAARFPDFKIHPETNELMQAMVKNGEVDALVAERVWQEFYRALQEPASMRFFEVLNNCHALPIIFPELSIETNGMQASQNATQKNSAAIIRYSALLHDIAPDQIKSLCKRLHCPTDFSDSARLTQALTDQFLDLKKQTPEDILAWIKKSDALRRTDRFNLILKTLNIIFNQSAKDTKWLTTLIDILKNIDTTLLQQQNLPGPQFATDLKILQLEAITTHLEC